MERGSRVLFDLSRYVFPLYCAGVAVLAAVPYLLPAAVAPPAAAAPPAVDSALSGVVSSVYAPDGRRRYRVESARVRRRRDGVLMLEPVAMQYYSHGARTLSLESESGRILEKGKRVELDGAVELDRPAAAGRAREIVSTRDVEVKTEEWIAVTAEEVVLRRERQVMRGRGMVADLRRGEISLLGDVEVNHAP